MYLKMDEDWHLAVTVGETLYRGDNLSKRLIFLMPKMLGEIDLLTAAVYLSYVRADGTAEVTRLERLEEEYKESWYQYTLPVTCRLTRYPGQVCIWMQIYSGPATNPVVAKSDECILVIEDSKNMDDFICDWQMAGLYGIQKDLEAQVAKKADGLAYDAETRELQLTSNDTAIGDAVTIPSDDYADTVLEIAEAHESYWDDMAEEEEASEACDDSFSGHWSEMDEDESEAWSDME
jgi:dGTP triphosphohydrolase